MMIAAVHLQRGDQLAELPESDDQARLTRGTDSTRPVVFANVGRSGAQDRARFVTFSGGTIRVWNNERLLDVTSRRTAPIYQESA